MAKRRRPSIDELLLIAESGLHARSEIVRKTILACAGVEDERVRGLAEDDERVAALEAAGTPAERELQMADARNRAVMAVLARTLPDLRPEVQPLVEALGARELDSRLDEWR